MTAPSLSRLLISHITLRGPELEQLYALVATYPQVRYEELVAELVPGGISASPDDLADAPLREALNFLLVAGLLEQDGSSRRKASFRATPQLPNAPFPLLLLHHITSHADERQRAPSTVYAALVADDTVSTTAAAIRDHMERGTHRTLFAWTGEKIGFWVHFADHLGLVRRLERSAEILVIPQPTLVLAALTWAQQYALGSVSLSTHLNAIDAHIFACFTSRGKVHSGLAQALLALEWRGTISMTHNADATHSLLLGERRVSEVFLVGSGKQREAVRWGE